MKKYTHNNVIFKTALLSVVFLFVLSAAPGLYASDGNWLNISLSGEPESFRPWETNDGISQMVFLNNIYECLVRYGDNYQLLEPCLAVSWGVEQAGKAWVFTLRDNVLFHDGSALTADDVVASFSRVPLFDGEVEKIDRLRFRCILPSKRSGFLKTISQPRYAITKVLLDGNVIGTGSFVLSEWNPKEKIILRSFLGYWGGSPSLRGVTFHCSMESSESLNLMREGKIDVVDIISPYLAEEIESDNDIVLSTLDAVNICHIHINVDRPLLDSAEFRQALNLAVNKDRIIKNAYLGQAIACRGLLPPAIGGESEGPARAGYNPEKARSIIAKHVDGLNRVFKMIGLPCPRPYCPDPEIIATMIIEDLKTVGLKVDYTRTNSMKDYLEIASGNDYDLLVSGWIIDSLDPDDFLTALFGIDGPGTNYYGVNWENKLFESSILQARTTVSVKKKWELYRRATDIFFNEYPWILLAHTNQLSVHRRNIRDLRVSLTGELRLGCVSKTGD